MFVLEGKVGGPDIIIKGTELYCDKSGTLFTDFYSYDLDLGHQKVVKEIKQLTMLFKI